MKRYALVISVCFQMICLVGCDGNKPIGSSTQGIRDESKLRTRDELEKAVIGLGEEEVLRLLGKPETTSRGSGNENYAWTYQGICYDPITKKGDKNTLIWFSGETKKVTRIRF